MLIKQGPTGMVAGEIATKLGLAPTNLSFHLKAMSHAGLVNSVQEGRFLRYTANIDLIQNLIGYLTDECCSGHPGWCEPISLVAQDQSIPLPPTSIEVASHLNLK
jgi:hypothetical protein